MRHLRVEDLTKEYTTITIDTDEALKVLNDSGLLRSCNGNTLVLRDPISIINFAKLPGCAQLIHNGWVLFS